MLRHEPKKKTVITTNKSSVKRKHVEIEGDTELS